MAQLVSIIWCQLITHQEIRASPLDEYNSAFRSYSERPNQLDVCGDFFLFKFVLLPSQSNVICKIIRKCGQYNGKYQSVCLGGQEILNTETYLD